MIGIAAGPSSLPLCFLILGQRVHVECADAWVRQVVAANFAAMAAPSSSIPPDLQYRIGNGTVAGTYSLACQDVVTDQDVDSSDVLYFLEKSLTVELQRRRADLYFLHAATIERDGIAILLAAESGFGKSTTTWGMLHHGFGYLSDELSPVAVDTMSVLPYPHALCLKRDPPVPYALPGGAMRLGRTVHVTVGDLPGATVREPRALGGVFLVKYRPELSGPELHEIGPAEAGARLYVAALNALAHANRGLAAAARIAQHARCFALSSSDLAKTCALMCAAIDDIARSNRRSSVSTSSA